MSVFSDFQRMWVQRFPQSSLSDAWEQDVRASLTRHKEKIAELTKELEQEGLYVEYLERLLSDVEKFKESGGDPCALFEASTPNFVKDDETVSSSVAADNNKEESLKQKSSPKSESPVKSPLRARNGSINEDEGVSEEVSIRKESPVNQVINELSSLKRNTISEMQSSASPSSVVASNNSTTEPEIEETAPKRRSSHNDQSLLSSPSHFVTVIEVKEPHNTDENKNSVPKPRKPPNSYENVLINTNANSHSENNNLVQNCDQNNTFKQQPKTTVPSLISERTSLLFSHSQQQQDLKKKVPPRPPPKLVRRPAPVEPPTVPMSATQNFRKDDESPSSSLERNIRPSDVTQFLRQKSSESLDVKNRIRKNSEKSDEFIGKKVTKSDSLKSSTDSPTGSLSKHLGALSGSLGKLGERTSNESVGSKESLASGGLADISQRMKSYESISSLSSDSIKTGGQNIENEPYYDSVPLDNGDGDYVYIQAGGTTGSTSSRDDVSTAGSTLPLPSHPRSHNSSQTSVQLEPESPGRNSNYVNIDYFIHSQSNEHETRSSSIDSDGDGDHDIQPVLMRAISVETETSSVLVDPGRNRNTIIRHIITSIIQSETLYVECLNKMKQYMKAIRATLTTSQPVISEEDFQTMFFKIEDLHEVHGEFLNELKTKQSQQLPDGLELCVGDVFLKLAGHITLYGAFLHNYGHAIDTVKKCGNCSGQFKEIVSKIVFKNQNEQSLSLEELLHKPVARVQKNALVLQDLLHQTPEMHPDYAPLKQASKIIRNFLSEFNVIQTKTMYPSDDKALRRLVKNSFIVELADGHRKLRHLFLYNDVIACAKYKASGRDRFEFELKWFIPLKDILICEESANDPKEASPISIVQLKSQACTVRDQIMLDEREEKKQRSSGSRAGDKHRKKLADLEAQLVLASPNLVFKISNKGTGKTMTFFLSSDFERTQWIDSILSLQQSCNLPGQNPVHIYDLQAWITACQALIKTEMGSYLMRNARDESLLVGDLHLTIQGLTGFDHPCDLFICVEIDSYGHYFRKAKTKLVCRSASPLWNESFVLELEGSQNLRILLYQDDVQRPILRAKQVVKLSRQWLQEAQMNRPVKLSESVTLNTTIRFVPGEVTLRRVPTSKPGALFGAKLQQVLKREKRDIPFIISACVREVERRGMCEIGIYRVSGSASDLAKLKKSFESNAYEAEQLLKEVDIHSVTGILKSYLRDLPEALFTDFCYPKLFETYTKFSNINDHLRVEALQKIFIELPAPNKATIHLILDHLIRVHQQEIENKMSLHNLAMVFGPTLLRPGPQTYKQKDLLESSTVDVMAQAGILYCFLTAKLK